MSARASGYAKSLIVAPNGETLSRGEKLVLIVLADNHQDKAKHFTYPSIDTIAEDALCDRRSCQRFLAALERKGVIKRLRPIRQGRGMQVFYFFCALDVIPEGWQDAALSEPTLFEQKGGRRAAKGRQKGGNSSAAPNGTRAGTGTSTATKANTPPLPPQAGESGSGVPREERDASKTKDSAASVAMGKAEPGENDVVDALESSTPRMGRITAADDVALGVCADTADLAKASELTAEQLAHLAKYADDPQRRAEWASYYRAENQRGAQAAATAAETARVMTEQTERLKVDLATVPEARAWVMRQCKCVEDGRRRGIGWVIEAVLQQQLELGEPLWKTAPKMAAARKKFVANLKFIRTKWGPVKFFKLGIWADERGWGWDEAALNLANGASVGSKR